MHMQRTHKNRRSKWWERRQICRNIKTHNREPK